MSEPSFEEMEAKRLQMIASFQDVANAMRQCVNIIEDYARSSPSSIAQGRAAMAQVQANMNQFDMSIDPALDNIHTGPADPAAVEVVQPKVKKVKKIKDPNEPSKPASAYLLYQNEVREKFKSDWPELDYHGILQKIAASWKALPQEERDVFKGTYAELNKKYSDNMEEYKVRLASDGTVDPSAIQTEIAINAANAVTPATSSGTSSDDSDDEEETSAPVAVPVPAPAPVPTPKAKAPKPAAPAATPTTLAAADSPGPKKEKKRKQKDLEPAVPATAAATGTPVPGTEKKKKKKKENKEAKA